MLLDPKVYVCSRTGADKVGYFASAGDVVHEFLSDDSEYDLYLNGHTVKVDRDYVLQAGDMVNAIHRPAGAVEAYIAVAVITAIITIATLPKPEKPNTQGTQSTSPNNQVSGQTNIARTGEGIPDIKGTIRAYPDLIQASWYTWEDNRRRVRERFCLGVGEYDDIVISDNDVLIDEIQGSGYEIIESDHDISDRDIYPVVSESISDSILEAENQRRLDLEYVYLANNGGTNYVIVYARGNQNISELLDLNNESQIIIDGTGKVEIDKTFNIDQTKNIITSEEIFASIQVGGSGGSYTILVRKDCYRIPVTVASDFPAYSKGSCTDYTPPPPQTTTCYPSFIANGYPETYPEYQNPSVVGEIRTGVASEGYTTWAPLNNDDLEFTWYMNVLFPQGLILKNGNSEAINLRVQARGVNSYSPATFSAYIDGVLIGTSDNLLIPVSGRSRSELGKTIKFVQSAAQTWDKKTEIRVRRDSNVDLSLSSSYVKLETIYAMKKYTQSLMDSGTTLIAIDAKSDFTNKAQSSRKINMMVSRKQWRAFYIPNNNRYEFFYASEFTGGIKANGFADAVLSDFIDTFGEEKARNLLDFDSLYGAFDSLPSELKEFNYSFDDADISLGQRIHTACNAARVGAYRDGQVWRFYREESKPVTYHFDRRNIAGNAESQMSFRFQKPNDHDSVSLSYIDPVSNKELHINRKINLTSGTFEEGLGQRPLEIDLAGCRNTAQAVNRAELEVRRLVYQRRTVSERVLDDGLLVDIGDRVRWACIYDGDIVDGELIEASNQEANTFKISEKIDLTGTLRCHVTDEYGNVQGPCSISESTVFPDEGWYRISRLDGGQLSYTIANNMPTQLGSRVIIGTTSNLDYYDFTVTSKTPNADGTVQIEMIEYNELMFSED